MADNKQTTPSTGSGPQVDQTQPASSTIDQSDPTTGSKRDSKLSVISLPREPIDSPPATEPIDVSDMMSKQASQPRKAQGCYGQADPGQSIPGTSSNYRRASGSPQKKPSVAVHNGSGTVPREPKSGQATKDSYYP